MFSMRAERSEEDQGSGPAPRPQNKARGAGGGSQQDRGEVDTDRPCQLRVEVLVRLAPVRISSVASKGRAWAPGGSSGTRIGGSCLATNETGATACTSGPPLLVEARKFGIVVPRIAVGSIEARKRLAGPVGCDTDKLCTGGS